jgi:sugar phosphate isomerase/epimerase
MTPRYGASLDLRFDETVEEYVAFLADLGLSHVELRWGYLDTHPDAPDPVRLREVASAHDVTVTVHAPHVDANPGNVNEQLRRGTVDAIRDALEYAATADAVGVVVHGGAARTRYPERVQSRSRAQAVRTLREAADAAAELDVPLCLENQRDKPGRLRNTATPDRLAALLADVEAGADASRLYVTLDVGHAKVTGVDYGAFVDRFGDRIRVAHLHDNDGIDDDHDPLPAFREVAAEVGAPYNVLEMKSLADVERCVGSA